MLSANIFARLEKLQPNTASEMSNVMLLAKEATDTRLLALCTTYIDAALRHQDWSQPRDALTEKEQAYIAFTEQFISSVGTMSDEQVECLLQFSSADEVYAFVNAIYVTDMSRRLELVVGSVIA